ncbi:MAG: DoxX family membrane protein, partial [Candidatus Marinimicrobia bacterium]|nr:DoxX family membrane protein [Candidatus Neomarinimicrobiota bacterium]
MNKLYPWILLLIRFLLGVIFIYASLDKIIDPGEFARAIGNYHIIPFGLENLIALVIPWLELFIGIGLISGIMVDGASAISGGLMAIFILLILQATLRGFNIECGCGLK